MQAFVQSILMFTPVLTITGNYVGSDYNENIRKAIRLN
jgi:hypothetical protein